MSRFHQGTATTHVRPHTNVDHRSTGPNVDVAATTAWIVVAEFNAKPDREHAVVAAVETRIELFRQHHPVTTSFLMASHDGHRVVAFVWVSGNEEFRELQHAWGQHEQHLARTDKEEKSTLTLCRCTATSGDPSFAVGSTDIVTIDQSSTDDGPIVADADTTILGLALLSDESTGRRFLLTRRSRAVEGGSRRYAVVRTWETV